MKRNNDKERYIIEIKGYYWLPNANYRFIRESQQISVSFIDDLARQFRFYYINPLVLTNVSPLTYC